MMAALLVQASLALPIRPPRPPALVSASWPPPGASNAHVWIDGLSAGPLGRPVDALLERQFRRGLSAELGHEVPQEGFAGVMQLCRELVQLRGADVSEASRRVLVNLFPNWPPGAPEGKRGLLYWFERLFAMPFPAFAFKLNAWVTWWAAQWLMGPCSLKDLEAQDLHALRAAGEHLNAARCGDGRGQQLLVHRCRFLEEAACASVCVNVCKMPTQAFFNDEMGVTMRMEPDYETLQCRFKFGIPPTFTDEMDSRNVACFPSCSNAQARLTSPERCHAMGGANLFQDDKRSM
ncbi:hypothetical protein AB1Y20_021486 [Prymnesium parvum]|uniref:Beta-carotene isomerase D27-like C-terminal domain-containing protein n=1 Tax=Prymnesium parvum TaxID=97485 RepID=A0AB34JID7_PRYPA